MSLDWLGATTNNYKMLAPYEKIQMLQEQLSKKCPDYYSIVVPVLEPTLEETNNSFDSIRFEVLNATDAQILDLDKLKVEINAAYKQ